MDAIYTCEDVAARYGVKLITVWDWIRKKKLNALRIGKRYYVTEDDIKNFEQAAKHQIHGNGKAGDE